MSYTPSPDGRHVVLALSAAGAEYSELRPIEVESRKMLSETVYPSGTERSVGRWTASRFSMTPARSPTSRVPEIELNRKTVCTRWAARSRPTSTSSAMKATPISRFPPRKSRWHSSTSCTRFYVVGNVATVQNEMRLFVAPTAQMMPNSKLTWSVLALPSDKLVRGIVFYKDDVYTVAHTGAPRYKIVHTRVDHPDWKTAETVVPEAKDSIQSISHSKSFLFVVYFDGIVGRLVKHTLDTGKATEVKLPASGTIDINCPDFRTDQCIVFTTSWIQPTTLYDFDAEKGTFTKSIFNTAISYPGFENLVTEEVEVPGHDGTMIPLSIIHRKDLKLDGSASAILEGTAPTGSAHAGIQRAALDCVARRRARLRPRAWRQRKRRGLVQGGVQDDQAEHVEGVHFVRGVPDQKGIHQRDKLAGRAPVPEGF